MRCTLGEPFQIRATQGVLLTDPAPQEHELLCRAIEV